MSVLTFPIIALLGCISMSSIIAQDLDPNDPFFELINPSNKPATGPAPKAAAVPSSETEAMLEKWQTYERTLTQKLNENIAAGRNVATEILLNKALTANPANRERIGTEVERIKKLPLNYPLGVMMPNGRDQRDTDITGTWFINKSWINDFCAGGLTLSPSKGGSTPWHWIDRRAGILLLNGPDWTNLFWLEKSDKMRVLNDHFDRYIVTKTSRTIGTILDDEGLAKLSQSEATQRKAMENDLEIKRKNLVSWLLSKAKELPPDTSLKLLPKITALEAQTQNGASRLNGVWQWDKAGEIRFQPGYVVTTKIGSQIGVWEWACGNASHFAVVLNGGNTPNDIFLAKVPKNSADLSTTVHRLGDGSFNAVRMIP